MQTKELDNRTFPELWSTLSGDDKGEIVKKIYLASLCSTPQTIWNWGSGRTRPAPYVRDNVAKIVSRCTGLRVSGSSLFPER